MDSAIRMLSYTGSKVPYRAFDMCDDYNAVDTFDRILCYMNDRRNKEDRTSVGILATARKGGLGGVSGSRDESLRLFFPL